MTAQELVAELVPGVLDLCLSGTPITVDTIKQVRPTLAAVYTERYSTIPTYLGGGRSADGLGLHRLRGGGAYQPSFENADLAIAAGRRLGWSDDQIAATVGLTWDELERQVEGLPMQETFFAAPPPAAPKAGPKATVSPPAAERRKADREAEKAQKQAEQLAEKAAAEAAEQARKKAEMEAWAAAATERRAAEMATPVDPELLAQLTDDEE